MSAVGCGDWTSLAPLDALDAVTDAAMGGGFEAAQMRAAMLTHAVRARPLYYLRGLPPSVLDAL